MTTLKTLLTALLKLPPAGLAVNCLFVPAESTSKSVKATIPLPALVPISCVVVPSNGPVPALRVRVTFWLAPRPTIELLPNWSRLRTTGCVVSNEPIVPLPGCVVNTNCAAAAGLTAMAIEVVLVKLPLVN